MDALVDWAIHHFQREFALIAGAPTMVFALFCIALFVAWLVVGRLHEARHAGHEGALTSKDAKIELLSAQVDEYKDKLSGATPDQAAKEMANLREGIANTRAELDMISRWWRHHTAARHISKEQAQTITNGISTVPPEKRGFFGVGSITEPECQQYAIEIMHAFQAAGACTGQHQPEMMWSNTPDDTGVIMVVLDANNPPEHAKLALKAFLAAGVGAKLGTASTPLFADQCMIAVSYKPPLETISPPA